MGLLSLGTPFHWMESRNYSEHVRDNGIEQLLNMFEAAKDRSDDKFLWGDEIEYMLVKFDDREKTAKLSIDKDYILEDLGEEGKSYSSAKDNDVLFHPEYGRFMIEATPLKPYNGEQLSDYIYVEKNMSKRREVAIAEIKDETIVPLTLTTFPRMGVENFTFPSAKPNGKASKSLFLPDEIINRHVRFPTLTANIRRRRGCKVAMNIPLFRDVNTRGEDEIDDTIPKDRNLFEPYDDEPAGGAALKNHIYMDSMGFGMGSSCLQVTMQAPNLNRSRYLYDSLVNLAPLMLALTGAAPIFRGFLADQDVRWNVIAGAVDDRPPYERDVEALPGHKVTGNTLENAKLKKIPKSRYDSVDQYLGDINDSKNGFHFFNSKYNNSESSKVINEKVYNKLIENGFDSVLANHFAHLYIRDPIVIFNERLDQDNKTENDHFENIQSTNWQTLRFKPPTQAAIPSNKKVPGWRVEFRPMEIQITDFENAAFANFIVLLSLAILHNSPNMYLPISFAELNMKLAHKRDAAINEKFNFKVNCFEAHDKSMNGNSLRDEDPIISQLTLDEIFNGCKEFSGIIPFVREFVKNYFKPDETDKSFSSNIEKIDIYLELISLRAAGKIPTAAHYIRDFVTSHKDYKKDSIVSDSINYDLNKLVENITNYKESEIKDFFGEKISTYLLNNNYSS